MKEPEELNTTETEEGTIALQKKRSRRVSFAAEITSVHVFDRDEDLQTPPDAQPTSLVNNANREADDEVLGFFRELADTDDSNDRELNSVGNGDDNDEDEDEVMDSRKSFFRSIDSPSPGSTIGSATSIDDEDNFFGPVSASFIRPGRYSDSAASEDDNHDVTMDSTAFSMHFRSLARSESGGDLKTPTGITNLAFEQKTETPSTNSCKLGSLMALTGDKKSILHSPVSADEVCHSKNSNDMSLVGENPHRYDYAKLSPRLDALLAEGSNDLPSDAVLVRPSESPSYPNKENVVSRVRINGNGPLDLKDSADIEPVNHGFHDRSAEAASVAHTEVSNVNSYSTIIPIDKINRSSDDGQVDASFVSQAQSSNHLGRDISLDQSKESIVDAFETSKLKAKFSDINSGNLSYMNNRVNLLDFSAKHESRYLHSTGGWVEDDSSRESREDNLIHYDYDQRHQSPLEASKSSISGIQRHGNSPRDGMRDCEANQNCGQKYQSALAGSMSSLSAKQRQVFLDSAKSLGHTRILTPEKWPGFFLSQESTRHSKSMSSIQKSISKLNNLRNSPCISTLQDGNHNSRRRLSNFLSIPSFDMNSKVPQSKHVDVPIVRLEDQFSGMDGKKVEHESVTNMDSIDTETPKSIKNFIQTETEETTDKFNKSEAAVVTSSPFTLSGQILLESENFTEGLPVISGTDSSLVEAKLETLNFQLGTPGEHRQTGTDPARFRILTEGEILPSSHGANSPYVSRKSTYEPSLKEIQSPPRKYSRNVAHSDNVHPSVENSSGWKRRREEFIPSDIGQMDEIAKIQRSPKVQKSGSNNTMILLELSKETNDERIKIGGDLSLKHSSDIFSKFSAELESLHSPLVDKLNLRGIGVLEDILDQLQKVKTFEMLCSDVQSQKISDRSSDIRQKRVSETRSLLCKVIYERAKLQLLHTKREILVKRADVLSSGTQESQSLKMNSFQTVHRARDPQVDDSHRQSFTVHYGAKHMVANDKVTTLKQEAEASERKIKHLTESFHTLLKVKGELSPADTLVLVNDHLKKRTRCRFIRQDLQSWKVDDFKIRNGHSDVVLNYYGFIFQRFTFSSPVSSTTVSSKLHDANIVKKFPNMDACTAFAFTLKSDNNRKYVGRRSLAQETQRTSSLLCNLLDVIGEVRLARLELSNLTDTRFHSPSVERLDLQLDFTDLRSGEKMILTLDMTCLDCGVYPSEILPSQFQAPAAGTQSSPPQALLAETKAALDGLRVGYFRIIRVCRCVSQVVEASSR